MKTNSPITVLYVVNRTPGAGAVARQLGTPIASQRTQA